MELEEIVKSLNSKDLPLNLEPAALKGMGLTSDEIHVLETYHPENTLIIYGTLAPGRSNHAQVAEITGQWAEGYVMGKVIQEGWGADMGYPGFRHTDGKEQDKISAFILTSVKLPANWARLDEFEGEEYQRILSVYKLNSGEIGVGYIYAINNNIDS